MAIDLGFLLKAVVISIFISYCISSKSRDCGPDSSLTFSSYLTMVAGYDSCLNL